MPDPEEESTELLRNASSRLRVDMTEQYRRLESSQELYDNSLQMVQTCEVGATV